MSRASKRLAKEKKKMKEAMGDVKVNCPNCGFPIPQDVFLKQDFGTRYRCKICGKVCFEEWVKEKMN